MYIQMKLGRKLRQETEIGLIWRQELGGWDRPSRTHRESRQGGVGDIFACAKNTGTHKNVCIVFSKMSVKCFTLRSYWYKRTLFSLHIRIANYPTYVKFDYGKLIIKFLVTRKKVWSEDDRHDIARVWPFTHPVEVTLAIVLRRGSIYTTYLFPNFDLSHLQHAAASPSFLDTCWIKVSHLADVVHEETLAPAPLALRNIQTEQQEIRVVGCCFCHWTLRYVNSPFNLQWASVSMKNSFSMGLLAPTPLHRFNILIDQEFLPCLFLVHRI